MSAPAKPISRFDRLRFVDCHTGKNDLMQRVTPRQVVFGQVIHSIFEAWHYEVLWTCNKTRLLWYACNYVRLILYIMLHSIKLPNALHCTLPSTLWINLLIALDWTLPACLTYAPSYALKTLPSTLRVRSLVHLQVRSEVHSQACFQGRSRLHSMVHSQPAWLYTPKLALKKLASTLPSTLSSTRPIALDNTLPAPAYLTIRYQMSSQDAPKCTEYVLEYTPGHAPKDAPTCTRWHTASLLACTLPN